MQDGLSTTFLAQLPPAMRDAAAAVPELETLLARAHEAGRTAWPELALTTDLFLAHVADRIATLDADTIAPTLSALHAADLYLACACARGDVHAIASFEREYFGEIEIARRRRRDLTLGGDDVAQLVRERLLVAHGGARARVADYSGRGSLRGWFRTAVVRLIANLAARPNREVGVGNDTLAAFPVITADPELEYMKRLYHAEFAAAFDDAVATLSRRERELLRRSLVEDLTIDQLAVVYGSHRATLARWIAKARESLFDQLRTALMKRLRVDKGEFESILRLIQSRFDITIDRLFRPEVQG
jgi:RNA polymerase sigma-70 factor (ECF subfamily)